MPLYIDVEGWYGSGTCSIRDGSTRNVTLALRFPHPVHKLVPKVTATYWGFTQVIETAPTLCDGADCPEPNKIKKYTFPAYVKKPVFWEIEVHIQAELYDENGEALICAQFPLKITNS